MSEKLLKAREYEARMEKNIEKEQKPLFHLIPRIGWMNDPNGFTYYGGKYHMFYQYNPYDTCWGPMHWGHAVSDDLLTWENLPCAMAPDMEYDKDGCFSGSAIELTDKRMALIYTGVRRAECADGITRDFQTQCIAIGDGVEFTKYEQNPVIDASMLPDGASVNDFRDPKIWKENDKYYCIVASQTADHDGQFLLYSSDNAVDWKYDKMLAKNNHRFGRMWECPDYFNLDGKKVILTSPQDMLPEELEFHNGNGTLCMIGHLDENGCFVDENCQAIDYGIDFYAPQTIELNDGRRVMIGWMQNWDTTGCKRDDFPWHGQMSIPREISIVDGRLIQKPIREIEKYYGESITRKNININMEQSISGIEGRIVDMTVNIKPADPENMYKKFEIKIADNGKHYSTISYDPDYSIVKIDRKYSGSRRAFVHQRRCHVSKNKGEVKLRIIMDRYSAEVFINDGEKVMTMTVHTDYRADGISFRSEGDSVIDIDMHKFRAD